MFSWISPKGPSNPPISAPFKHVQLFDPLKGGKGAERFYSEVYETTPKCLPKQKGSAAIFFEGYSREISQSFSGSEQLCQFLQAGVANLRGSAELKTFRVVLGNEAADLDSISSAIAYSFFLSSTKPQDSDIVDLPVIGIPRRELRLRTDVSWLLHNIGIDVDTLVFSDEVDLEALFHQNRLQLILVDHSVLKASLQKVENVIVEIVDHHAPSERYAWVAQRTIHQVGSCSTLVAEIISEASSELLGNVALCRLLLAAILSDTANLDPTSNRCDPRDEIMAALLVSGAGSLGRSGFADLLMQKRFDQMSLSTSELLRRDYKEWTLGPGSAGRRGEVVKVGICSVGISLAHLVGKDDRFSSFLNDFIASQGVHILIIMCLYPSSSGMKRMKRELALCSALDSVITRLAYWLQNEDQGLKLKPITVKGFPPRMKAFSQGTVSASRKVLQPLLEKYFEQSP